MGIGDAAGREMNLQDVATTLEKANALADRISAGTRELREFISGSEPEAIEKGTNVPTPSGLLYQMNEMARALEDKLVRIERELNRAAARLGVEPRSAGTMSGAYPQDHRASYPGELTRRV
jgi:hypothetical protein